MNLFVNGSRSLDTLSRLAIQLLDRAIANDRQILIGDAPGVDREVQKFLSQRDYPNVTVYFMELECRNNIGNWPSKSIANSVRSNGFRYQIQKDFAMARESDAGLAFWDKQSAGTINNILNMLEQGKHSTIVAYPEEDLIQIKDITDLEELLSLCLQTRKAQLDRKLNLKKRMTLLKSGLTGTQPLMF